MSWILIFTGMAENPGEKEMDIDAMLASPAAPQEQAAGGSEGDAGETTTTDRLKERKAIGNGSKVSELANNFKRLATLEGSGNDNGGGENLTKKPGSLVLNSTALIQVPGYGYGEDDVFEKVTFPHAYKKVRAMRMGAQKTAKLGQVGGITRVVTNTPSGLAGFDLPEDDRQFQVVNYHIPALRKNISTSVKKVSEDSSQLICVTCEEKHFFTGKEPVLVVLADQHFPPSLPSSVGQCVVVMRCEDAMLHELPGLLKEFFAGQDGQVMLPDGSAVLFGSLSHLAARGLDNYADEVVKTNRTITGMVSCQITVAHNIFVPLGGVCSEGLVRMMIDLDSWLQCGDVSVPYALTRSREKLWEQLLELGENFSNSGGGI
jgi:hypothetical protein